MSKTCATCRAFYEHLRSGQCRLHPQMVPTAYDYWCLDWQAKEKAKAEEKSSTYQRAMRSVTNITEFDLYWAEVPNKIGKKAAQKAFQNAQDRPPIDDLLTALRKAKLSPQWVKDGGQFIPHPATWLNRGQWADVPTETKPSVFEEFLARGAERDESTGVFTGLAALDGATVGEDVSE